nr:hypothetical protein BaRGS_005178 [Batillaria attramentaria]
MHAHFGAQYHWFMRADDDLLLRPEDLGQFLASVNSSRLWYLGQPGTGVPKERGKLGLRDGTPYCMGGPGVLLSAPTLGLLVPHLAKCAHQAVTSHEDTELGRCVQQFVNISCSKRARVGQTWIQMKKLFYQNYREKNGSFTGALDPKIFSALTLHPVKDARQMYRLYVLLKTKQLQLVQLHQQTLLTTLNGFEEIAERIVFFGAPGAEDGVPESIQASLKLSRIPADHKGGTWAYGVAALTAGDLRRAGGLDTTIKGWGKEDVDLYSKFNSKGRKVTILQCYAPTNVADEEEKENFYEQLQAVLDKAPRRDLKILMGDLNAQRTQNENGELFTEFCTTNDLVIGGTIFPHKTIHKTTWTSPDGRTVNQIDHITIGRKWRRSLLDVRAKRGADAASDHHLVIAAIKIKLKAYRDQADRPSHKYNVHSLKESVKTNAFRCELRNRFSALDTLPEETIEEHWHDLRETWTATCREVLGKKTRQHKEWLTSDTWDLITERKRLKDLINHTDDQDHKRDLQAQYWDVNRQVKRSARNDKRNFINDLTEEAETAAGQRNMKRLYEITRTLSGKNNNPTRPVKDKKRTNHHQRGRPKDKTEIIKAIKSLKSGKAAGPDGIPPEALKADIQTSTDMLHPLLRKIWESESVPQDWKKGHLVKLPKKGDLSSCSNWRGIMLLSIPGKVLTRIILERLKTALDKTLREEQAGFRNDRSCTDHIATMRIIIEQSLEWQTPPVQHLR